MIALRPGLLVATPVLLTLVALDAGAVAPDRHHHDLEVRRAPVAVRAGLPGAPEVKLGRAARVFGSAAAPAAEIETATREVIGEDRGFFRVQAAELGRFRTRSFLDGMTYVDYTQLHRGVEVVDSNVTMIFKDGKHVLTTRVTFDDIDVDVTPRIAGATAERIARESLAASGVAVLSMEGPPELVVYPQESGDAITHRLAWRVVVRTENPVGRFRTIVAADGANEILDRHNLVAYDAAQILLQVEPRTVGDAPVALAAKGIRIAANNSANLDGVFEATPGDVTVTVRGPWFTVDNKAANERTKTFPVSGGAFASYTWMASEGALEELDSFYHLNVVRERQLGLSPDLGFFQQNFPVNVNVNGTCNAYFDGSSVNFFPAGGGCNSTGRIADVMYHEYGHAIHFNLTNGNMVSQIQEGVADYFAHTITNDPNLGPYFFPNNVNGIRNAEQVRTYPSGVQGQNSEVHESGKIWTNTWWNLRKKMIAKHGAELGVKYADLLHTNTLRGNPGYTTVYNMALAADDDDGNLDNGTPNSCEITAEFQSHGLVTTARQTRGFLALTHTPPSPAGFYQAADAAVAVSVAIASKSPACGDLDPATVTLHYRVDGGAAQTVALTGAGTTFSGQIPGQREGAVVEYWFSARETAVGAVFTAPLFAPANAYRYYVGPLNTVFLDDFETDQGWTHGGATASEDDWERGAPNGVGLWDPVAAFSGSNVIGNDLGLRGGNGLVERGASNWIESPAIDCRECEGSRLQFRRWLSAQAGAAGDLARVLVNGTVVWTSADYAGLFVDRHWELVDIPIGSVADGEGVVKIRFELASNNALELGGWAIDDVAIKATSGGVPPGETPNSPGGGFGSASLDGGCTCSLSGSAGAAPRGALVASLFAGLALAIRLRRR